MLVSLGKKSPTEDLVGLLLECHERIRSFSELAVEIARRDDAPSDQIVDACRRCERYFVEALPLHVADEEESLLPRMRGLDPDVDAALDRMQAEHRTHEPLLASFLEALRAVERDPTQEAPRAELLPIATEIRDAFEEHLVLEEKNIFPTARELTPEAQKTVIEELRRRRG